MNIRWRSERAGRTLIEFASALLICVLVACDANDGASNLPDAAILESLSGANIRHHMEVLAADDMQGRAAGTPGHLKAAEYVAAEFARIGLQPIGDDGSYFQYIDFLETTLQPGSASLVLHKGDTDVPMEFGKDFVLSGHFATEEESVTAPLVFVGFGIQALEYGHDDFAGVDTHGKIVVELTGAPPKFANDERAYYSSGTVKQALAVEMGALGIVSIRTPIDQQRLTWTRVVAAAESPGMRWLQADGAPHDGFPKLIGSSSLSESGAEQLFLLAGRNLESVFQQHADGAVDSFDMDLSVSLIRRSVQRPAASPNVLALLPGSDPELGGQYLLFTAHLDGLGVQAQVNGDDIYNGAYDNAAGVAIVIEVANAMSRLSPAPRRSIIFAAVTAEEKGLRGSDFLAHHPPVAIRDIVANINIDMPYLGYPIADVEGYGVDHSTLQDALITATERIDVVLSPDAHPELVRLVRSDQFSFVQQGVPGLNLKPGSNSSDLQLNGSEMQSAFLREHYHEPSDDLTLAFSKEGAAEFLRVALTFGLIVANEDQAPRWKEKDFFGARFAK